MNNLEKEILAEIEGHMMNNEDDDPCLYKGGESQAAAKSVASVAMKWIEKALECANGKMWALGTFEEGKAKWLKDSGLTPTEPDTKEQDTEWDMEI